MYLGGRWGGAHMGWGGPAPYSFNLKIRLRETLQPQLPESFQGTEAPLGEGGDYSTSRVPLGPRASGNEEGMQLPLPRDTSPHLVFQVSALRRW